jgi:hypothetical protein
MPMQDHDEDEVFDDTVGEMKIPSFVARGFRMVKGFADVWDIEPYAQRWGGLDMEAFARALKEGQGENRAIAICALGSTGKPWVRELLLPYLGSPDPKARWASALMFGEMKEEQALPVLQTMLLEFLPSPTLPFAEQEPIDPLYDFWRPNVAHLLGNWLRPDLIPLFAQALALFWKLILKDAHPGKTSWIHCQDELAYALGRLGAFHLLTELEFPASGLRLAMVQMALGYLHVRARFPYGYLSDFSGLSVRNPDLVEEVISVLEQQVGLPRLERKRFLLEFSRANQERTQLRSR